MNLLYIINGLGFSSGMPIGGADKRALEIGNRLIKNHKVEVAVLTTDAGKEVLEKEGFKGRCHIIERPRWWPRFLRNNLLGRALAYLYIVLVSPFKILSLPPFDVIYPTSDIFFDLVPALLIKRFQPQSKMVGIVHHHLPLPWKRPGSIIVNSLIYLSQRLGFGLFLLGADLVLVPSNPEGEEIKKDLEFVGYSVQDSPANSSTPGVRSPDTPGVFLGGRRCVGLFKNGVDFKAFQEVPGQEKVYEACFLGGLRPSKGIFDLPDIWFEVVKKFPKARLLVIGGGVEKYRKEFEKRIREKLLKRNVKLAGVVPQKDLIKTLKSCRIFISPSYEEGWGIVICEALSCGLPVVAYTLPAYKVFGDVVNRVPVGDTASFSREIIKLLENDRLRARLSKRGLEVAKKFDWDKISEEEFGQLVALCE